MQLEDVLINRFDDHKIVQICLQFRASKDEEHLAIERYFTLARNIGVTVIKTHDIMGQSNDIDFAPICRQEKDIVYAIASINTSVDIQFISLNMPRIDSAWNFSRRYQRAVTSKYLLDWGRSKNVHGRPAKKTQLTFEELEMVTSRGNWLTENVLECAVHLTMPVVRWSMKEQLAVDALLSLSSF